MNRMKSHAVIVLKDDQDRILFVQRSATKKSLPNIWAFPSGTVEDGEPIETTIRREAMEELGVTVEVDGVMGEMDIGKFGVRLHFVACRVKEGEARITAPDEIQALRWLTFGDFFAEFSDDEIGHGLIWLRSRPELWGSPAKSVTG